MVTKCKFHFASYKTTTCHDQLIPFKLFLIILLVTFFTAKFASVTSLYYNEHTIKPFQRIARTRNILLYFWSTIGIILHTAPLCIRNVLSLSFLIIHQSAAILFRKINTRPLTNSTFRNCH